MSFLLSGTLLADCLEKMAENYDTVKSQFSN